MLDLIIIRYKDFISDPTIIRLDYDQLDRD